MTENEYLIPLSPDLYNLYKDEAMGNSLNNVTTASIRPALPCTEIT